MTIELTPLLYNADETATCGDCQAQCRAGDLNAIRDPHERLTAGDPLPAGECVICGSLSYVAEHAQRFPRPILPAVRRAGL